MYLLIWKDGNFIELKPADESLKTIRVDLIYSEEKAQDLMGFNSALYRGWAIGSRSYFLLIESGFFGKQSINMWSNYRFHGENFFDTPVGNQFDAKGRIIAQPGGIAVKYECE